MDLHIITSGKGGVGKTLLSLMLLTYFQKDNNKSVFVIDLNGVNADLRRLCCVEDKRFFHSFKVNTSSGKEFEFTCYRENFDDQGTQYVIGWPSSPYRMSCEPSDFIDFLAKIKEVTFPITARGVFKPDTIIIDTSFHFCNIFSDDDALYDEKVFGDNDNFFIWFLWVYRQLRNLLLDSQNNNESDILIHTAGIIEEHVTNVYSTSPFIHVFNVYGVDAPSNPRGNFVSNLFRGNATTLHSKELEYLLAQRSGKAVCFETMYQGLKNATPKTMESEAHDLFLKTLKNYAEKHKQCPRNMVPIPTYHRKLEGYTDAYYKSERLIKSTYDLPVFKKFSKSLERLLKRDI